MLFKYNWKNQKEIETILTKIYQNSIIKLKEDGYNEEYAKEFVEDLEDYLICTISFKYNLTKVINALKNLEYISFQKISSYSEFKNIIPIHSKNLPVISYESKILLNDSLETDQNLTKRERRKLYLFHGLTHNVLNFKNDITKEFSQLYSVVFQDEELSKQTETIVYNGWLLLEYAVSQEIAERYTYYLLKKPRPKYNINTDESSIIIDEHYIISNLEFVRMFQPILVNFGKSISSLSTLYNYSQEIIIYNFLKRSMNGDFPKEIIEEYFIRNNQIKLYQMLYLMGLLLNAEYSKYNLKIVPKLITTVKQNNYFFEQIEKISNRLITLSKTSPIEPDLKIEKLNDITKYKILKLVKDKEIR